jgi:alanine racemase
MGGQADAETAMAGKPADILGGVPAHVTSVLLVDLGAIRRNYRLLAARAAPARAAAVVKANGYGLGSREVAQALAVEGCDTFFVATLHEAQAVREAAPRATVYVLDGLPPGSAHEYLRVGATPVLGSIAEIDDWVRSSGPHAQRHSAAIHIDTGMTRLGLDAGDVRRIASHPSFLAAMQPALVMSHLACGDEPDHAKNVSQLAQFSALSAMLPQAPRSLANSAGVFLGAPFHFDLVRPGIALYGGAPLSTGPNPMEPVATLLGRVLQVRWAERGETVGYGAGHTLSRRTRIATVSTGYADGYLRALSASDAREGAFGVFEGQRLPMLGRVSMDLIMFDVTDAPGVARGDFVELIGRDMTVDKLAGIAGTISYEILTSIGRRAHRIYVGDDMARQ